jgi:hypothetical protein
VVKIYPNPAKDEVTVNINGNEKVLGLTLTDMNGKVVLTGNIIMNGTEIMKKLDVSSLSKGTYLLRLTSGERSYSEKLVIR